MRRDSVVLCQLDFGLLQGSKYFEKHVFDLDCYPLPFSVQAGSSLELPRAP